jgi:hypothetical protein
MSKQPREFRIGKSFSFLLLVGVIALNLSSCMTVRGSESMNSQVVSKEQFANKKIAIFPVKAQTALTTDSLLSLRTALNEKIDEKIKGKLPDSTIIDTKTTINILNDSGKLEILDDIVRVYENTGVFDKKLTSSLFNIVKSDYIVFSRLKAEKMSIAFMGKGFGASLEVVIIGKSQNDVIWGGSGEYKRGGVLGFGTTENKTAAEELIRLAFQNF